MVEFVKHNSNLLNYTGFIFLKCLQNSDENEVHSPAVPLRSSSKSFGVLVARV